MFTMNPIGIIRGAIFEAHVMAEVRGRAEARVVAEVEDLLRKEGKI